MNRASVFLLYTVSVYIVAISLFMFLGKLTVKKLFELVVPSALIAVALSLFTDVSEEKEVPPYLYI